MRTVYCTGLLFLLALPAWAQTHLCAKTLSELVERYRKSTTAIEPSTRDDLIDAWLLYDSDLSDEVIAKMAGFVTELEDAVLELLIIPPEYRLIAIQQAGPPPHDFLGHLIGDKIPGKRG